MPEVGEVDCLVKERVTIPAKIKGKDKRVDIIRLTLTDGRYGRAEAEYPSEVYWNPEETPAPEGVTVTVNRRYRFQFAKLNSKDVVANIVKEIPDEKTEAN